MVNRRDFIKNVSAASLLASTDKNFWIGTNRNVNPLENKRIWSCLLHLSFNMWEEYASPDHKDINRRTRGYQPTLRLSEKLWDDALIKMKNRGINLVLIDLGDAVRYKSHPEIAVEGAWTTDFLVKQLKKIRQLGIEPIPKLNFSAGHDTWLGDYSKMLSTPKYYEVCRNLIAEAAELFDRPRFIHIGMDEETAEHQRHYQHIVVRQNEAWWKDFLFLVTEVEKQDARAWIWSDYVWRHPDVFFERMPKSVLQSNWFYGRSFDLSVPKVEGKPEYWRTYVNAYNQLEAYGYDQIPCGGYYGSGDHYNEKNIMSTVQFCKNAIDDSRLKGFLLTLWRPTIEEFREPILKGIDLLGEGKAWFDKRV